NVLMYFDTATRADVLERMADSMAADGVLLLGENEVPDIAAFKPSKDGQGFYVKNRASFTRMLDQRFTA
ncbi:MAG TPA: CheR family methyltransferase, partial [Rhizomicrobium sp.]|nr:CheR family methyltransferase [Rhizomicrobium sp.]